MMGMRMRFSCGEHRFEVDVEPEVIQAMVKVGDFFAMAGARPWPVNSEMAFDSVVPAQRLREALATVRRKAKELQGEMDYIFGSRGRPGPGSDLEFKGPGSISGFHIGGEPYSLDCGLNQCVLSRWRWRPDGIGEIVSTQDIRGVKHIDTDDWGRITITKRRAAGPVDKWIRKVLKKLQGMEGDVVVEMA